MHHIFLNQYSCYIYNQNYGMTHDFYFNALVQIFFEGWFKVFSLLKSYHLKCNIPCTLEKSLALDEVVAFSLKSRNHIIMILSSEEILYVKYPCVKCLKCGGTHRKRTSQSSSFVVHSFFILCGMEFIHLSYFKMLPLKTTPLFDRSLFFATLLPPLFNISYSCILSY